MKRKTMQQVHKHWRSGWWWCDFVRLFTRWADRLSFNEQGKAWGGVRPGYDYQLIWSLNAPSIDAFSMSFDDQCHSIEKFMHNTKGAFCRRTVVTESLLRVTPCLHVRQQCPTQRQGQFGYSVSITADLIFEYMISTMYEREEDPRAPRH